MGPNVALGMRRLSIIDVAGGAQPIASEDGTVQVVFNGEIYNHHALRERLGSSHVLRSRTDTEVLVHLYEDHQAEMVHQLRGMFAFAIWDDRAQRLTIARDRLGIKPLYYWQSERGLAFASELRSFLALKEFPREIDVRSLREYLALGYVPDPDCIFAGVRKLSPGHVLTWEPGLGTQVKQYWSPARPEVAVRDEREAIEELRRLLADAVGSHLESDVPLGAFLSGGIDSSTVVAEMTRLCASGVKTFSIGFDEPEFNEAPHAANVARALGTTHTELVVRPDADALLESLIESFDEPFGDSSALPTLLVCELARTQVTVALSGDGGDELFGGYERYGELEHSREFQAAFRLLARTVGVHLPSGALGRNWLLDRSRSRRGQYAGRVAHPLLIHEGGVLHSVAAEHTMEQLLDRWFEVASGRDFVTQMTLVDMLSYLPGDILTKVDRTSMSVSLEARVPLLDHPLVEFAASLPGHLKRRNGQGKWILREAVKDLLPPSVFAQPKRGFAVPLAAWFRKELSHRLDSLLNAGGAIYEYVDRAGVQRLVNEHRRGRRDHSHFLWRLLVLEMWLRSLGRGALGQSSLDLREARGAGNASRLAYSTATG